MALIKLFSREYSVQYTETAIRSLRTEVKRHIPSLVFSQVYLPEQKNEACYVDPQEWQKFLDRLSHKYKHTGNLKLFFKQFHLYGRQYVAIAQKIRNKNLEQVSIRQLIECYRDYQKSLIHYSAYLWMGFFLSEIYSAQARDILSKKGIINPEILSALFRPTKRASILALQDKLAALKGKSKRLSGEQIKSIIQEYSWMPCLDIHNNPWTAVDVRNFFKNLKPQVKTIPFTKALRLSKLSKPEKIFFKQTQELIYVKDMRDEYRRRGIYNILSLFEAIGSRLGLFRAQLAYFSSGEIIAALEKKIKLTKSEAAKRQKGFLIYMNGEKVLVTADRPAINKFVKKHLRVESNSQSQTIVGKVANGGYAKGIVKIVTKTTDLGKVAKGNILVAITTHPDFVPAMQKAAAIVTDEGGLTSHAAIVSRELGIPCVVGTKFATKVLKDGDLAEVDASNGVVRKIK